MKRPLRNFLLSIVITVAAIAAAGCAPLPGSSVASATSTVYAAGSRQYTVAVELAVAPPMVFETMLRLISERPDAEVVRRNDKTMLIEIAQDQERRITGQVTKFGSSGSLLYIWADAGSSGLIGREMAMSQIRLISHELGVDYKLVNY
jgi:hypothetical protein